MHLFMSAGISLAMAGCQQAPVPVAYDYGTANDTARRYYHRMGVLNS